MYKMLVLCYLVCGMHTLSFFVVDWFLTGFILATFHNILSGLDTLWWGVVMLIAPPVFQETRKTWKTKKYKTLFGLIFLFIFPIVVNIFSVIGIEHRYVLAYRWISLVALIPYLIYTLLKKMYLCIPTHT